MGNGIKVLTALGTACVMGAAVSSAWAGDAQVNTGASAQNRHAQASASGSAGGAGGLPSASTVLDVIEARGGAGASRIFDGASLAQGLGAGALGTATSVAQAGRAKGEASAAQGKGLAMGAAGAVVGQALGAGQGAPGLVGQGKALVLGAVPVTPGAGSVGGLSLSTPGVTGGNVNASGASGPQGGHVDGASAGTPAVGSAQLGLGGGGLNSTPLLAGPELVAPQLGMLAPQIPGLSGLTAGSLPINGANLGL